MLLLGPVTAFDFIDARMLESKGIIESVMSLSIDFNYPLLKNIHNNNNNIAHSKRLVI